MKLARAEQGGLLFPLPETPRQVSSCFSSVPSRALATLRGPWSLKHPRAFPAQVPYAVSTCPRAPVSMREGQRLHARHWLGTDGDAARLRVRMHKRSPTKLKFRCPQSVCFVYFHQPLSILVTSNCMNIKT